MASLNLRFKTGVYGLNCTASAYAALSSPLVSKPRSQQYISQLIAGTRDFESEEEAAEHFAVIETMSFLKENIKPRLPIAWSDVPGCKDIVISTFEARRNESDPVVKQPWFVRLNSLTFFKGLRADGSISSTINPELEGAAFEDYDLADEVRKRLQQMDTPARIERLTALRRKSTLTVNLEELGFKQ